MLALACGRVNKTIIKKSKVWAEIAEFQLKSRRPVVCHQHADGDGGAAVVVDGDHPAAACLQGATRRPGPARVVGHEPTIAFNRRIRPEPAQKNG